MVPPKPCCLLSTSSSSRVGGRGGLPQGNDPLPCVPIRTGMKGRMSVSSAAMHSPRRPTSTCTCAHTQERSPSSATSVGRPSAPKVRQARPLLASGLRQVLSPTLSPTASLDKHNRTHTGERPFSCEFCEQRFTEKGPLLRHVASRHQEGRPHFCQICGKTFKGN